MSDTNDIRQIFKVWAARNFAGLLHVELGDSLEAWCVMLDGIELVRCASIDDARETNELVCDFIAEIGRREDELNALRSKLAETERERDEIKACVDVCERHSFDARNREHAAKVRAEAAEVVEAELREALNTALDRAKAAESSEAKLREALVDIGRRSGRTVAEIAAKALKETEAAR